MQAGGCTGPIGIYRDDTVICSLRYYGITLRCDEKGKQQREGSMHSESNFVYATKRASYSERSASKPAISRPSPRPAADPPETLQSLERSRSGLKNQTLNKPQTSPDRAVPLQCERI
jgi:hypothetical protein